MPRLAPRRPSTSPARRAGSRPSRRPGTRLPAGSPAVLVGVLPDLPASRAERVRRMLEDRARVERLARTFKALGDPTRSRLVFALSLEELCVTELAEALGTSLSATSHQLRILRDLEIVRVRRAGKSQLYALNETAFGFCSPRSCHAWKGVLEPGPERAV